MTPIRVNSTLDPLLHFFYLRLPIPLIAWSRALATN
jgi:hypothetical protein